MKDLCMMPCNQLKQVPHHALKNHYIDWKDVSEESFGIPNEDEIVDRPFQFGITVNEHGRVIGFFIGNVFFYCMV